MTNDLIVTIVNKGSGETVVEAAKSGGAEGATILFGRGTGRHEYQKLWGIPIEPEKEIVLTVVSADKTDAVLDAIVKAVDLDSPGAGIAFVVELKRLVGVAHLAGLKAQGSS